MQSAVEIQEDSEISSQSSVVRVTALLFVFAFFTSGIPRVFTQNASYSLFISAFGADAVPYAYIAQAICIPLAGWIYLLGEHRLKFRTLLIATLSIDAAALILARIGLHFGIKTVVAVMIVWNEVEFVMSSLLLWGLANQLMTLRQGKKYFGFVIAGEPVATIIFGLATPLIMKVLKTEDLFLLSAGAQIVGIGLVVYITQQFKPLADTHEKDAHPSEATAAVASAPWWKDQYIALMIAMIFLSQMVFFFLDETFYLVAEQRYPADADMASFLGIFSAIGGGVSLAVSLFVAAPLVRRFGVRGGLLTLPLLLLIGSIAAVAAGVATGVASTLFFVLSANKLIDHSFRYTVDKTTSVTLYQPLPAGKRMKLQAMLESVVEPLSGGVAGLMLSLMLHGLHFTPIGVSAVIAVIVVLWLGFVIAQAQGYGQMLRKAIAGRQIDFDPDAEMSEAAIAAIRQGLNSRYVGEVLFVLEVLGERQDALSAADVSPLLDHAEPEARAAAASWFEGHSDAAFETLISQRLASEGDATVRGALIMALAACSDDHVVEQISGYLEADDESEQLGAYCGMIRHGGLEGVILAGNRLISDINSTEKERRSFAAAVMRQVGSHLFYRPLMRLLSDSDDDVRAAALFAASAIDAPALWPVIAESLTTERLLQPAIAAVAAVGDPILSCLSDFYAEPATSIQARRGMIVACGAIGSAAASEWLVERLDQPNRELRHAIIGALTRGACRAPESDYSRIKALINEEIASSTWMLKARRDCAGHDESRAMLVRALAEEVDNSQLVIFQLLGLILPGVDMFAAWLQFTLGGATKRSYVLEMLDQGLENATKVALLPLLEPDTLDDKLTELEKRESDAGVKLGVDSVARANECHLGAWAPASALYALAQMGSGLAQEVALHALQIDNRVLNETAKWIVEGSPNLGEDRKMLLTIEKVLILRSVSIFANVRESALTYVAQSAREVQILAGEPLFAEGDLGDSLYVVVNGSLRVHLGDQTLAELGEREAVGEMSALDPEPRSASVTAIEDSLLLLISSVALEHVIADDVRVASGIIRELCKRLRANNARLTQVGTTPVSQLEDNPA